MPDRTKQLIEGKWEVNSAGKQYRYLTIDGKNYRQWDNDKGPVYAVESSTPRTLPTASPSVSERRPIPTGHDPRYASDQRTYDHRQSSYLPPEGHQPVYSLFPREGTRPASDSYSTSNTRQQYAGTNDGYDEEEEQEEERRFSDAPNGIVPSKSAAPVSQSQHMVNPYRSDQAKIDQSQSTPEAKVVRRSDRIYYPDRNGNSIRTGANARNEPSPGRKHSNVDDLTDRLATTNMQGESWRENDSRSTPNHLARPREELGPAVIDQRHPSARSEIPQHASHRSAVTPYGERSQPLNRAEGHQVRRTETPASSGEHTDGIDGQLSNRSASGPPRPLARDVSVLGKGTDTPHALPQRQDRNDAVVPTNVGGGGRRSSVVSRSGLDTIIESRPYKGTKIKGDDRYGRSKEMMDHRYIVRDNAKSFFILGRVFALLWHESAGSHGTDLSEGQFYDTKFGEKVYSTIRRMVVVKPKHGHCTCVPISTYGGQGTLKPGLSPADIKAHAVIYMVGTSSEADPREKIVKNPIAVEPAREDQKLLPMSRINFDKGYTIEHNVKVMNVGKVAKGSMANLSLYYRNTNFEE